MYPQLRLYVPWSNRILGGTFAAMSIQYPVSRRRVAIAIGAAVAALVASVVSSSPAHADDSTTLTVVGTSDVFDSNLIQSVIKPGFEAAFPGVTLNYVSKGTGAAIQYAEAGSASALLVHAPSLENQFVAAGSRPSNTARRSSGATTSCSARTRTRSTSRTKAPHNIAAAFQLIAGAGANHKANFVSRGGTPGTTVQEHAIWALTKGVKTCVVSDANGGGVSPSTTTGNCPVNIKYPNWYHATGLTQGPNIVNADTCNYPNGNCYVLTDRGTYNYLQSTGAAQNLKIVTRNNNPQAPRRHPAAGQLLPRLRRSTRTRSRPASRPRSTRPRPLEFLHWVTSPAAQTAIGQYLNGSNDPPFLPDASPRVTATAPPATTAGAKPITISGKVSNVVPGTPPLAGEQVTLLGTDTASPAVTKQIATTTTDSLGKYSFTFKPTASRSYTVTTPELTQIEYPKLNPVFGDLLAPSSTTAGSSELDGLAVVKTATPSSGALALSGHAEPADRGHQRSAHPVRQQERRPGVGRRNAGLEHGEAVDLLEEVLALVRQLHLPAGLLRRSVYRAGVLGYGDGDRTVAGVRRAVMAMAALVLFTTSAAIAVPRPADAPIRAVLHEPGTGLHLCDLARVRAGGSKGFTAAYVQANWTQDSTTYPECSTEPCPDVGHMPSDLYPQGHRRPRPGHRSRCWLRRRSRSRTLAITTGSVRTATLNIDDLTT